MNRTGISDEVLARLQQHAIQTGRSVDDVLTAWLDEAENPAQLTLPYPMLLAHTTDTIALFDPDLRYLYVNPVLGELMGFEPADMIGKTDRELGMAEAGVQFLRQAWEQVIETGVEQVIIFDFQTSQGQRTYEARLTPIYDEEDALIYLLAITRDVTQRHQTEKMLKDIADQLPGMILTYKLYPDGHDEVPFVSQAINTIYEISPEEALADIRKIWAKVHPDDLQDFAASIQASAQQLSLWDYEWRIRMNDGTIKWIAGLGTPHRIEDGSTMWNTLLLDITLRKQLEAQQQELLDQWQLAIETAQLGIWRLEVASGLLEWNDQQLQIYGIRRDEFDNQISSWRERVHPDDREYADARLQAAVDEGQVHEVDYRIIRPDGEVRYIRGSASVLRGERGQVETLIAINIDVTDLKRGEQIALERQHLLATLQIEKERNATIQHIVAKLAHDIRMPLSIISTSRDLLSKYFERLDVEKRQERLETIRKQLAYVTQLLNDLTLIHDFSPNEPVLSLAPCNMKVLSQITLHDVQESVGERHTLVFIHDFRYDLVMVDDVLIHRILLNLLSNAVKYSAEGSEVKLSLREAAGRIVLQITDQGMGIPEDELPKIFDPFYRVNAIKERVVGNGLGLSIVKECVERHNGYITVESVVGQGTTFTVRLPLILPEV